METKKFILLTGYHGDALYFNVDYIALIRKGGSERNNAVIHIAGEADPWSVQETPQEVFRLIGD